ncbi:MAG: SDR family oxidoreductase [Planctomycetota bacterium]
MSGGYLILGATSGVGRVVAETLHAQGAKFALAGRDAAAIAEIARPYEAPTASYVAGDAASVAEAFGVATQAFGEIAGVVNLAGTVLLKPAHITTDEEWAETVTVNLTSSFHVVREAAKAMRKSGGSVVLMASAAARTGLPNHEAIAAAKAGVIGLTRSAAATYGPKNIRFNAVAPGLVKTKMTERIWGNEAQAAASASMHALGRLGEPGQVASIVTWLLTPASDWVTGQVFGVDGGLAGVVPKK